MANAAEALREVTTDIARAGIVMVKPALPYLDIVAPAKDLDARPSRPIHRWPRW
jgi:porphobilinogen synthase